MLSPGRRIGWRPLGFWSSIDASTAPHSKGPDRARQLLGVALDQLNSAASRSRRLTLVVAAAIPGVEDGTPHAPSLGARAGTAPWDVGPMSQRPGPSPSSMGGDRQLAEGLEHRRLERVTRAAPAPVALATGHVHARLVAEIEDVLERRHGQRRWRRPRQGHQSRGDVPALAGGPSQRAPDAPTISGRQTVVPAARRVLVENTPASEVNRKRRRSTIR
jgi:hypothetical protein